MKNINLPFSKTSKSKTPSFRLLLSYLSPAIVLILALLVGGLLIILAGQNPIEAYISLLNGAFGSISRFSETLVKTIPLLIMGLAISIAFKNGFWNIGGEGQFLAGATLSTWLALSLSGLPPVVLSILCFLAGFIGGAVWGGIAGLIKVHFNVNEVISTLMLNYVALYMVEFLIRGPLMDQTSAISTGMVFPQSALIPASIILPRLIQRTRLHAGLFLAIIVLILVWLLWRTKIGYEIETSGANKEAARFAGINTNKITILVSLLSGGLAGLVGWNEIFGVHYRLLDAITAEYGFIGIIVALLGGLQPIGVLVSSFLMSVLYVGGNAMERATGISFAVVNVINGTVIVFLLIRSALAKKIRGIR